MIKIDGGMFTMGATSEQGNVVYDDEKPIHDVTLSNFYMGETEVTQGLWETVMTYSGTTITGETLRSLRNVWPGSDVGNAPSSIYGVGEIFPPIM